MDRLDQLCGAGVARRETMLHAIKYVMGIQVFLNLDMFHDVTCNTYVSDSFQQYGIKGFLDVHEGDNTWEVAFFHPSIILLKRFIHTCLSTTLAQHTYHSG